jgi:hypothetical protein
MPKRFLDGVVKPRAYPLGLVGSCRMDPCHNKFVRSVLNRETWRLSNVEILVLGLKTRLSYSLVGGIEEIAKWYAGRHWYDVRVFREIVNKDAFDPEFAKQAKGFVVFDDGSEIVRLHKKLVRATGKPVRVFKLPEEE